MHLARRAFALVAPLIVPTLLAAQTYPSKDDPRSKLKPGRLDAGTAANGHAPRLVHAESRRQFDTARGLTFINSDLAFGGNYVYQGNFAGFTIWDVSNPAKPKVVSVVSCITSQGDPSIYGNLLFLSAEGGGNRNDCAKGGVQDPKDHMAGVRIYDVSESGAAAAGEERADVQRLAHAHDRPEPRRTRTSSTSTCRAARARVRRRRSPGCKNGTDPADETNSLFRLDVIKVPLEHPEKAEVVTGARIFTGLDPAPRAASRPARSARALRAIRRTRPAAAAADRSAQLPRRHGVSGR